MEANFFVSVSKFRQYFCRYFRPGLQEFDVQMFDRFMFICSRQGREPRNLISSAHVTSYFTHASDTISQFLNHRDLTQVLYSAIEPVLVIFWPTFRWAMLLHYVARLHHARHEVILLDDSPRRKRFRSREEAAGVTVVAESRPLGPWPHIPVKDIL